MEDEPHGPLAGCIGAGKVGFSQAEVPQGFVPCCCQIVQELHVDSLPSALVSHQCAGHSAEVKSPTAELQLLPLPAPVAGAPRGSAPRPKPPADAVNRQ